MPLFGRGRLTSTPDAIPSVPGLAEAAAAQGWQPVSGNPFDGHLEDAVHDISRAMYGAPRGMPGVDQHRIRVGPTVFSDAFRASIDGRAVVVSNAWTNIESELYAHEVGDMKGVAVCAAELPSMLPLQCLRPRQLPLMVPGDSPTGNPSFDNLFLVAATSGVGQQVLTPDLQQLIMARDDWVFWAERFLLGCVSKGPFGSAGEVSQRIGEVMKVVAAIPTSVLPDHVDHSEDDLAFRISQLTNVDDAIAMLQQLTQAERDQVARSDTPLAAFADVRTPEEAMTRFQALDPQLQQQVMAMFMRAKDTHGRS